jgi:hypothetical protein
MVLFSFFKIVVQAVAWTTAMGRMILASEGDFEGEITMLDNCGGHHCDYFTVNIHMVATKYTEAWV